MENLNNVVMVFDTETTSLDKPFCYNIGYTFVNVVTGEIVLRKDFVVEQVWHNPMLFTTAYYANKREIYVERMRARTVIMNKFGYICQEMIRDIKAFNVTMAFAFNSSFDEKVFNFNCDWFKCNNPFDDVEIKDIRGFVHQFMIDNEFKAFCDEHGYYTDNGNYSTTAETMFRYMTDNIEFEEEHTALSDSEIETSILLECLQRGADINNTYETLKSIPRLIEKELTIKRGKEVIFTTKFYSAMWKKTTNTMIIK